jgi:hypothetical protein
VAHKGTCETRLNPTEKDTSVYFRACPASFRFPPYSFACPERLIAAAAVIYGYPEPSSGDKPRFDPRPRPRLFLLSSDREEDAERTYALLADGGEIFMKMEKTPFANRFAMLRDSFGTSWMLLISVNPHDASSRGGPAWREDHESNSRVSHSDDGSIAGVFESTDP